MVGLPAASRFAHSFDRLLLCWLQHRCVSWTLFHASGSPPRLTGMISSTSALIGCGVFNVLSTGLPQMAHTSYAASTLCLSMRRRYPLLTRSLRRLLMVIPSYEVLVSGISDMADHVSTRDPVICGYPLPRLFMERLRRESNPRIHSSRKEEDPKICDRCDLPLIPTKAWTGGLSITASRKRGIGLPATVGVCPL